MFYIKLANLNIGINNKYEFVGYMCSDYITSPAGMDFSVTVSTPEIMAENTDGEYEPGYLESLAVYRRIAEKIIDYNGFLMHGVVIEARGTGVAFLADSGVGKSTHANLWQEYLGNDMTVINGDKPIVRVTDGIPYAYGTPWAGKEGLHKNTRIPLNKICFIDRAEKNECVNIGSEDAFRRMVSHVYKPKRALDLPRVLGLMHDVIDAGECYVIKCNMEPEAAELAVKAVLG